MTEGEFRIWMAGRLEEAKVANGYARADYNELGRMDGQRGMEGCEAGIKSVSFCDGWTEGGYGANMGTELQALVEIMYRHIDWNNGPPECAQGRQAGKFGGDD